MTPLVRKYIGFHDELCDPQLSSDFPYDGVRWTKYFRKISGRSLWKLRKDYIANDQTADLIAVAEKANQNGFGKNEGAAFGGCGTSGGVIWIPCLDGGLLVDFTTVESQWTNALSGYQVTLIGGSMCFRYLLHQLGFMAIRRTIADEKEIPTLSNMEDLLAKQHQNGTREFDALQQSASSVPNWVYEFRCHPDVDGI